MNPWDAFYGPNVGYALELYERYQKDPNSVDAQTRAFFDAYKVSGNGSLPGLSPSDANGVSAPPAPAATATVPRPAAGNGAASTQVQGEPEVGVIVRAARLARGIREYGHLAANIDPLGNPRPGDPMIEPATHHLTDDDLRALPASIVWPAAGPEVGTCLDAINRLRAIYCGSIGYEFDHVENYDERIWLHNIVESQRFRAPLSPEGKKDLLRRLTEIETFEKFLHTVFVGQKRFSIEGNDMLVPMLDDLIRRSAEDGTREVLLGMAHRGRLNVLAHVLGKPYASIFSEFHAAPNKEMVPSEGSRGINYGWTGDVKYHLGARTTLTEGETVQVQITLADNPSHLEFVNPVVEGFARAAQDDRGHAGTPPQDTRIALPVNIHGDAAFTGEGVVTETLNLSRLPGYTTGGTINIIVNNQIGFTTEASAGRSTLYASDPAKGFGIPIVHVNADDPEACLSVVALGQAYRTRFQKDFLIDLVGYRRWGHNEGDEPAFTQPRQAAQIREHSTVRALYAEQLMREGVITEGGLQQMQAAVQDRLQKAREGLDDRAAAETTLPPDKLHSLSQIRTAVSADELRRLNEAILARPEGFTPHPRLDRLLQRRRQSIEDEHGIDWGMAENLAFASILADGHPIRLSGQDSERGTFSQRHLVLHDTQTGTEYVPLQHLPEARASFAVYNSPLTETAVLAFEYGYSVHAPDALVLWEAQFGDFANAGQVIIDQFLAGARAKWRQEPALVLLLPHGYEGQGPEHSSGRLERYLQLAAEDNFLIANCTTSGQYFHLLRLQAAALEGRRRPLIVMTPKSLLRDPYAAVGLADLSEGSFQPLLQDPNASQRPDRVERLVLSSGKVGVDVSKALKASGEDTDWLAVTRVELLYPFPNEELREQLSKYPHLREVVWLQEEPRNMGAWRYVALKLQAILPEGVTLSYVGRPHRASTAEGSPDVHASEQHRIVESAMSGNVLSRW